jgi:hypothetical protein
MRCVSDKEMRMETEPEVVGDEVMFFNPSTAKP